MKEGTQGHTDTYDIALAQQVYRHRAEDLSRLAVVCQLPVHFNQLVRAVPQYLSRNYFVTFSTLKGRTELPLLVKSGITGLPASLALRDYRTSARGWRPAFYCPFLSIWGEKVLTSAKSSLLRFREVKLFEVN